MKYDNDIIEKYKQELTNIQKRNARQRKALERSEKVKKLLQERIDKAIEYIEQNIVKDDNGCGVWWYALPDYTPLDELLSILKGENND